MENKLRKKVRILSGFRITIPEDIRDRMGLRIGQEVLIEARGGEIIIKVSEEDPIFMMKGLASGADKKFGDDLFLDELKKKVDIGDVR